MTDAEKISLTRVMLGTTDDTDDILSAYLQIAGQKIIDHAYPFRNDITVVPTKYHPLQCEIATYLLNRRGSEGETTHNENGINRSYESADIPQTMLNRIIPFASPILSTTEEDSEDDS